ncbi:MAG TPA: MATE family efflux transporter [Rhodobacteraceae bacterium]|nr:MATE family efflux transporter [Paracoccaceae bacterium]
MSQPLSYPAHLRALIVLGLPLVGGHLAQFAIQLTDTVMLGWYGVAELAAVTLATSYFFLFFMFGSGFAMAVMPMIAALLARDDETGLRRTARMGMWLSVLFALACIPAMWWSDPILRALGQAVQVSADSQRYLRIAGWGLIPGLAVMVLQSYLAAQERTQVVLWITVLAAALNALFNYALIFGAWGLPEMGLEGAALASVLTQSTALLAAVAYVARALPHHDLFARLWRPDMEVLAKVFRLGVPIGLTSLAEVTLFTVSTLMMGWLGTLPLAAHGIAIKLASAAFMVHLAFSSAATIRAGNAFGRGDRAHLARGAVAALVLSLVVSGLTMLAFLGVPGPLVAAFLEPGDPQRGAIVAIGVGLLAVAALFQTVDGLQVVALGLLRGMQDTTVPMLIAGLSYGIVGLGASYLLGFTLGLGGIGVWLGLVAGLSCAAGLLLLRFWRRSLPAMQEAPDSSRCARTARP